ncbi:hypothetical protein [Sulfuriroseicoccus oceanibius]|uniref:Uncharacterized protein n=1 Tax=Sulfuriroseicoccus oceanibius TaxID=2707525 RepID=A0A6B3LEW3_9BACT|nr:hypothetical protein [Sulfuriroseicoccus oceanibius]QQL45190.1 hypothetical protein G3M56_000965 [Sulfuriroseicoccus oceanibius]
MKNAPFLTSILALAACIPTFANEEEANQNDWIGEISTPNETVQVGAVPSITWNVTYPLTIDDLIVITGTNITTKQQVVMEVRLIGAGWGLKENFHYVDSHMDLGSGWTQIFFGDHHMVNASEVIYSEPLPAGTSIDFGGRGGKDKPGPNPNQWSDWFKSNKIKGPNVVTLLNGDPAPQYDPAFDIQTAVEDYLTPYVNTTTETITLGPFQVIYLFDFNTFGTKWYDLQDTGIIVTFSVITT